MNTLLCLIEISSNSFDILLVLEIHVDRSSLDFSDLEDSCRDLFSGEWHLCLREYIENHIENCSITVSPFLENVDSTTDENEFLISDEFIVDSRDFDWLREGFGNGIGDIEKVHRFFFLLEDIDCLILEGGRIEDFPFLETDIFLFSLHDIEIDIHHRIDHDGFDFSKLSKEIDFEDRKSTRLNSSHG